MPETLESLVAKDDLPKAFNQLKDLLVRLEKYYVPQIDHTEGRYTSMSTKKNEGTLSDSALTLESNQIRYSFLAMLQEIREELNKHFSLASLTADSSVERKNLRDFLESFLKGEYKIQPLPLSDGSTLINMKALDLSTDKEVVIKVLKIDMLQEINENRLGSTLGIMRKELKKVTHLKHRNIVKILDTHVNDYPYFIITEYIWGVSIQDLLMRIQTIPYPLVIKILAELCETLDYVRNRGIYQTRTRPDNIMLDEESKPILSAFELVHADTGARRVKKFKEDCLYLAPELLEGSSDPDTEPDTLAEAELSDQFSLGLLAYEMLTGAPLFGKESDSIPDIVQKRSQFLKNKLWRAEKIAHLEKQKLPAPFIKIIKKVLDERPEKRYPDLLAMAEALRKLKQPLSPQQKTVLESYCRALAACPDFTQRFYDKFFETFKGYKERFKDTENQYKMLQTAQRAFLESGAYHPFVELLPQMRGHEGLTIEQYEKFIDILLETLAICDPKWPKVESAWKLHREQMLPALKAALGKSSQTI